MNKGNIFRNTFFFFQNESIHKEGKLMTEKKKYQLDGGESFERQHGTKGKRMAFAVPEAGL